MGMLLVGKPINNERKLQTHNSLTRFKQQYANDRDRNDDQLQLWKHIWSYAKARSKNAK